MTIRKQDYAREASGKESMAEGESISVPFPGLNRRADLHVHTHYSDGVLSPSALVEKMKQGGISVIAVTDHDTVAGVDEAMETGAAAGMEVIAGVELSAVYKQYEIHVLGFFINHRDDTLREYLSFFQKERIRRAREMVKKLNELNIPVDIQDVLEYAEGKSVGRPHIASAVVDGGFVKSYIEVFHKYLGNGKPAYVDKYRIEVDDAVRLIHDAGGVSFIAHPDSMGIQLPEDMLMHFINAGIDGLETVHPSLPANRTDYYRGIVQQYYLLECGGSDFHGGKRNDEHHIGAYSVSMDVVEAMRKRVTAA